MNEESRQTVAGAYAKIEGHEQLCAERYSNIHTGMADMKATLNKIVWLAASGLLGTAAWLAIQLYGKLGG